uniref:cysteine-S-conjugate beta-lyase n=1 Tax=Angomonas desouzai TaxID=59800 RepID=U5KM12_9TRYP|nr:cystathionine beta-lyase [Angomonas desouzai]
MSRQSVSPVTDSIPVDVHSEKMDPMERISALETEILFLRDKVSQMELLHAVSAAHQPNHTVLSALASERAHYEAASEPTCYDIEGETGDYNDLPTYPRRPHFNEAAQHPSTHIVTFDGNANDPYHPSSTPIYQTATFVQPDISEFGPYDYSRSGNPTRTALETLVAQLEGAHAAFAFSSGMAALQTLVTTVGTGNVILASSDLYGGMHRLLTQITAHLGIEVVFVETWRLDKVKEQLEKYKDRVKLLHLESPTNPLMRIVDIRAIAELAHGYGAEVSIDNTMMSPVRCTPLELGCDYSMHSATKFLCGHSDTMCGVLCTKTEALSKRVAFLQNAQGNALAPFDCWLLLRGIKTLSIRVEKQELNAVAVALFLARQKHVVRKLHYAGLNPKVFKDIISLDEASFDIHRLQTTALAACSPLKPAVRNAPAPSSAPASSSSSPSASAAATPSSRCRVSFLTPPSRRRSAPSPETSSVFRSVLSRLKTFWPTFLRPSRPPPR